MLRKQLRVCSATSLGGGARWHAVPASLRGRQPAGGAAAQGRFSFVGAQPALEVIARGQTVTVLDHVTQHRQARDRRPCLHCASASGGAVIACTLCKGRHTGNWGTPRPGAKAPVLRGLVLRWQAEHASSRCACFQPCTCHQLGAARWRDVFFDSHPARR